MIPRKIPTGLVLAASLIPFPSLTFPAVSERRAVQAREAYDEAVRLREALQAQPEETRQAAGYEKAIQTFKKVYRLNPGDRRAPLALKAVGELYEEMGHVFESERYFLSAAQAYKFLIAQYPYSRMARDALYALGELYLTDLEDLDQARSAFKKFVELHPKSVQAPEARRKLNQLRARDTQNAPAPPRIAREKENPAPAPPAQVTAIRRWVGPNYTRIVVGLEGEAKFETTRLAGPDRIVLDLPNSYLSSELAQKTFPIEDGYLHQIRVAQFKPAITRIVLDVARIEDYTVFSLPNPFRLVVDIHGAPPQLLAEKAAGPEAASEPSRGSPAGSVPARTPRRTQGVEPASLKSSRPATASRPAASPRTESGAATLTRALGLKIGRVVIDPGHGGDDTGTIGPNGLREKDVVLDIALRLKKLLERKTGSTAILTRSDDTFVPLEERTAIANEKAADLFISIHANASSNREARGVETYYLNFTSDSEALEVAARENATSQESVHQLQDLIKKIAMTEKVQESQEFARLVQREVHRTLVKAGSAQQNRGLKKAPFVVLIGANMPSILAEVSFLTHPRDARLLRKPRYRQKVAEALYLGITGYVKSLGGPPVTEQARRASPLQASTP